MIRWLPLLVGLLFLCAPDLALACPSCAGNNKTNDQLWMLAGFTLFPFLLCFAVAVLVGTIASRGREKRVPVPVKKAHPSRD